MMRSWQTVAAGVLLGSVACGGQVVAIKMPGKDPNPQAFYTCVPERNGFICDSERTLNQYELRLEPSEQKCEHGFYQLHVETNGHGNVSRIQYQCAAASVRDLPAAAPSIVAGAGGEPGDL